MRLQTMPLDIANETSSLSSAERLAQANVAANLFALGATQPRLAESLPQPPEGLEWIFGRDAALTALNALGKWWNGCSIPYRAASTNLSTIEAPGRVSCFLAPAHAAQLRVALDLLRSDQALITVCPNLHSLAVLLRCEDFSKDLSEHRLWFAWGDHWAQELDRLFEENAGLPTPSQFIRASAVDMSIADGLIPAAQEVFSAVGVRRNRAIVVVRDAWAPGVREDRLLVLTPMHFRMWEDAGHVIAAAMSNPSDGDRSPQIWNTDDPARAATAALAAAAAECTGVLTAGLARADLKDVVPLQMPLLTWVVSPRIPTVETAGPRDGLLLADPAWLDVAAAAGWPADRLTLASWPDDPLSANHDSRDAYLLLAGDTRPLDTPKRVADYSSHALLWEAIREEMLADPFAPATDFDGYLIRHSGRLDIPPDGLDRRLFLEQLLVPAYQQGLARTLLRQQIPLRLMGEGWSQIPEFAAQVIARPENRTGFRQAIAKCAAMVYSWPVRHAHPMQSMGRPIIYSQAGRSAFLQAATIATKRCSATVTETRTGVEPITFDGVMRFMTRLAGSSLA